LIRLPKPKKKIGPASKDRADGGYGLTLPAVTSAVSVTAGIAVVPGTPGSLTMSPGAGTIIPVIPVGRIGIPIAGTHGTVIVAAAVIAIVTAGIVWRRSTRGNRRAVFLSLGDTGDT